MDRTHDYPRPVLTAVFVVAFALLAAACGGVTEETEFTASPEVALLTGEFETLDGDTIDLASLEGQDVVLWFWAPW